MAFPILRGPDYFPVPGFPMGVARHRMGYNIRHGHEFHEIVLVASGKGLHSLFGPNSDTPDQYVVSDSDLFFIPPGWSHGYDSAERAEIYNIIWEQKLLDPDFNSLQPASQLFRALSTADPIPGDPILRKIHLSPVERSALEAALRTIMRENSMRQSGFQILAKAKLMEALTLIDRAHAARLGGLRDVSALLDSGGPVAQAVAHMENHFAEDLSLEDIARVAHLSTAYFCESFRNSTGLTPMKYLNRLRLEHARYLLLHGELSIQTVASQCGFQDSSYFTRAFKEFTGKTPREVQNTGRKS